MAVIHKLLDPQDWEQFEASKNHVISTLYQAAVRKRLTLPYEFEQAIADHPELGLRIHHRTTP